MLGSRVNFYYAKALALILTLILMYSCVLMYSYAYPRKIVSTVLIDDSNITSGSIFRTIVCNFMKCP